MIVGVIILSVVIVLLCCFNIWFLLKRQPQVPVNVEVLQKDISSSKESLEQQVQQLKEQLTAQNTIISNFKENWIDTDRDKTEKIATLITQLGSFQGSLNKKEDDYKSSTDSIKKQVSDVIIDLATLKESSTRQNTIINNFKDTWTGTDREKGEKIVTLIKQLESFQNSLNKKEDDYKRSAEGIQNQVGAVIKDLATLKESSLALEKISDNIQTLQEVFINTKKRGNVGEYLLEKILTNMLGANRKLWERQYKTNDGNMIDAYIKTEETKEGIAIDSKFSFDNYQKYFASEDTKVKAEYLKAFRSDVRKRIDEVAKYINPKNDISSAIMFIPSEEIFTFIYGHYPEEVVEYAFKRRVWITSPTTLAAIVFTIDKNNKDIQFNRNIETIRKHLIKIKGEFDRWITRWEKVKKSFETTNTAISELDKTHNKLANQYTNILEKPLELIESE